MGRALPKLEREKLAPEGGPGEKDPEKVLRSSERSPELGKDFARRFPS